MPFDQTTKTKMFTKCGRLCCLCVKKCGTNIEAAHIVDESSGGSNKEENGIPLCLDCHQEVGAWSDGHPKGNKFRPEELRARRDHLYELVDSGVIYAYMVAGRVAHEGPAPPSDPLAGLGAPPAPSREATRLLMMFLSEDAPPQAPESKIALLPQFDRAFILDQLLALAPTSPRAITVLAQLLAGKVLKPDERRVAIERILRSVVLFGDVPAKARLLTEVTPGDLAEADEALRQALFEDALGIIRRDQYDEVNKLVPALVNHEPSLPQTLKGSYVLTLLAQARSHSFNGAPAARKALSALSEDAARAGLLALDGDFLKWHGRSEPVREFVRRYRALVPEGRLRDIDDNIE